MSTQKTESCPTIRSSLHNRRIALLSTFIALIFISELVQAQFLEPLNLGFGIELSDVFGLIGLTFTGWYAAPLFATAHAVANPGLAVQIIPRDFLSLAMAGLAIDRLKSQPWIRDQQWLRVVLLENTWREQVPVFRAVASKQSATLPRPRFL